MSDQLERVCRHEAGHAAVGQWLGWESRGLTVEPGTYLLGCARYAPPALPESAWDGFDLEAPFALWNPEVRNYIEAHTLGLLAGGMAALLLAPPRAGRQPPSVVEQAAVQVEALASLPEPAPADVAVIRKMVDTPAPTDAEWVAKLAHVAHGPDLAAASSWLEWMEAAVRSVIVARRADIERLAGVAAVRRTLSGEQVAACLRE